MMMEINTPRQSATSRVARGTGTAMASGPGDPGSPPARARPLPRRQGPPVAEAATAGMGGARPRFAPVPPGLGGEVQGVRQAFEALVRASPLPTAIRRHLTPMPGAKGGRPPSAPLAEGQPTREGRAAGGSGEPERRWVASVSRVGATRVGGAEVWRGDPPGAPEESVSGPFTTDDAAEAEVAPGDAEAGAEGPEVEEEEEGSQRSSAPRGVELLGWVPVADPRTGLASRVAGIGQGRVGPWMSERIVAVQGPGGRVLRDAAGVAIELKGRVDGKAAVRSGCPADARRAFRDGFPAGWAGIPVGPGHSPSRDATPTPMLTLTRARRKRPADDAGDEAESPAPEGRARATRRRAGGAAPSPAPSPSPSPSALPWKGTVGLEGLRTTRAGRVVLPVLDYWRSETMRYDREGRLAGYERGFEERIAKSPPGQNTASFVTRREALQGVGSRGRGRVPAGTPARPTPKGPGRPPAKDPARLTRKGPGRPPAKAPARPTRKGPGRPPGRAESPAAAVDEAPSPTATKTRTSGLRKARAAAAESLPSPSISPPSSPPRPERFSRLRKGKGKGKGTASEVAIALAPSAPLPVADVDLGSEGEDYVWSD